MNNPTEKKEPENENKVKARIEMIRAISALITPLIVAMFGVMGTIYLGNKSRNDARTQLYTQLVSQRERAETALRSDMFKSIIDKFLNRENSKTLPLKDEILQLQLLALNFHESLALTPLFKYLEEEIEKAEIPDDEKVKHRKNLINLARDINHKQIAILSKGSVGLEISSNFSPTDFDPPKIFCIKESSGIPTNKKEAEFFNRVYLFMIESVDTTKKEVILKIDTATPEEQVIRLYRREEETKSSADSNTQNIESGADPLDGERWSKEYSNMSIRSKSQNIDIVWDVQFPYKGKYEYTYNTITVSYFDFPMVDFIRLPDGKNCAFTLQDISNDGNEINVFLTMTTFSGELSGFKEKHHYEDVVRKLLPD